MNTTSLSDAMQDRATCEFIALKADIDDMLARLAGLSSDMFGLAPDEVHYGHVGTLTEIRLQLRRVTDFAFCEGGNS